jgi:hypothetical protein
MNGKGPCGGGCGEGRLCPSGWSSFLQWGSQSHEWKGLTIGQVRSAEVCPFPMYDANRKIPRGELVDIPEVGV